MKLSALWAEFKAFAFKGNMIDLAVAVVIGAAFSNVINSLVNDVVMPTITYVVTTTTTVAQKATNVAEKSVTEVADKTGLASTQPSTQASTQPVAQPETGAAGGAAASTGGAGNAADANKPPVDIKWKIGPVNAGAFIGALLNFLLVAGAVFILLVKFLGAVMQKVSQPPAPSEPVTKECPKCLSIIPIRATKCAHCTADLPPGT